MDEGCLTDDAVLDFVNGRLGERPGSMAHPTRGEVERHLGDCTLCSRLVAVAAGHVESANGSGEGAVAVAGAPAGPATPATEPAYAGARPGVLPEGTVLRDTYRIARLIGRGGMGEVYEATHARLPGRYAVKVLHQHTAGDPKAIARFRREAEITSALRHPSIVAIIDFDSTPEGAPYLVMEYLDGTELARVIANEAPLPLPRVLHIVDQIASALSAVHRRGIVHRDLKPQNIFLLPAENADDERVKLVDFGISKVRVASVALTGERVLLGTPQYMAPEQAKGLGEVDERADQFALAAIIYEMLTGRLAFPGDRVEVVVYRISHEDPPPLGPPWGAAIEGVLKRALEKDPARRYGALAELASALRAAAAVEMAAGSHGQARARDAAGGKAGPGAGSQERLPDTIALRLPPTRRRALLGTVAALAVAALIAIPVRRQALNRARAEAPRTPGAAAAPTAMPAAMPAPAVEAPAPIPEAPRAPAPAVAPPRGRAQHQRPPAGKAAPAPGDTAPAPRVAPPAPPPSPDEVEPPGRGGSRGSLIEKL